MVNIFQDDHLTSHRITPSSLHLPLEIMLLQRKQTHSAYRQSQHSAVSELAGLRTPLPLFSTSASSTTEPQKNLPSIQYATSDDWLPAYRAYNQDSKPSTLFTLPIEISNLQKTHPQQDHHSTETLSSALICTLPKHSPLDSVKTQGSKVISSRLPILESCFLTTRCQPYLVPSTPQVQPRSRLISINSRDICSHIYRDERSESSSARWNSLVRRSRSLPELADLYLLPSLLTTRNLDIMSGSSRPVFSQVPSISGTSSKKISAPDNSERTSNNSSPTLSVGDQHTRLELSFLFGSVRSGKALSAFPKFKEWAMSVIDQDRDSIMGDSSFEEYETDYDDTMYGNEASYVERLHGYFIKRGRNQKSGVQELISGEADSSSHTTKAFSAYRRFSADGIQYQLSWHFPKNSVPVEQGLLSKLTLKQKGVTTPIPDHTYGYFPSFFQAYVDVIGDKHQWNLKNRSICYPFLTIEWKGADGNTTEAELQSRRGGAATHQARRLQRAAAFKSLNILENIEPDEKTATFSATIDTTHASLWVHWSVYREGYQHYHMSRLHTYDLRERNDVATLRRSFHNILDWGIKMRKIDIEAELQMITGRPNNKRQFEE